MGEQEIGSPNAIISVSYWGLVRGVSERERRRSAVKKDELD